MSTDVYPNGALLRRPPAFLVIAAERGSASCVDLTPRTRILARDLIGDARTRTGEARESGELGPSMDTAFRCSPYARTPATDWIGMSCDEFVNAAHRKMRILEYHLDCLENAIEGEPNVDPVPIPVQAHFRRSSWLIRSLCRSDRRGPSSCHRPQQGTGWTGRSSC